jgi:hypothetical protein
MREVSPGLARPLAVGVLHVGPGLSDAQRRDERLDFALKANHQGYFLLETVEVHGPRDEHGYAQAEDLAVRADADAFVVRGAVDLVRLTRIADRVRMTIRRLAASSGNAVTLGEFCSPSGPADGRLAPVVEPSVSLGD